MRKFFVLLAYGALAYRAEYLQLELDALEQQAADLGGELGGLEPFRRLMTDARRARAVAEELLPAGTASDRVAVGGADLFSEYERKFTEVATKLGVDQPPDAAVARRQLEAVCVAAEPVFDPADVPALTTDPDDDLIVWTALRGGADLLVSDDRDVVPDHADGARFFEHGERSVLAVRFGYLVGNHLDGVDWEQIDGALLAQVHRLTTWIAGHQGQGPALTPNAGVVPALQSAIQAGVDRCSRHSGGHLLSRRYHGAQTSERPRTRKSPAKRGFSVRPGRLELPRANPHKALNLARLPIPPQARDVRAEYRRDACRRARDP